MRGRCGGAGACSAIVKLVNSPQIMSVGTDFLRFALKRFRDIKSLGDKTFAQLSEDELNLQPNESSNSIAVIVQHLHGNMLSRWTAFLTEDGEKPWRKRDAEFEEHRVSKEQLLQLWEEGWRVFLAVLESLNEEDLLKTVSIRQQPLAVTDAILRQLGHYGYHVGQIVYLGRWVRKAEWQSLSIPRGGSAAYNESPKK